ncbi:DJ-1 protein family protein [Aphelenchoides fujianensis]|nr:DJ-1 protein family protein [Aphelenchoides fujianensis]
MRDFSGTPKTMSKTALIVASDGSEDIELIVTSDILRRANVNVTIAGLQDAEKITLARDAVLSVDKPFKDVADQDFDAVIIPGGPGHKNAAEDKRVGEILKRHEEEREADRGDLRGPRRSEGARHRSGRHATAYSEENVVVHNNQVVTSRGPGTAFEFALKIVELLAGNEVASNVRQAVLL